jgi:GNAT superfamily N-acetyltransferase
VTALPDLAGLGLAPVRLALGDRARVTELCARCREFFTLVVHEPGAEANAVDLLEIGPPGVEPARKHVFGFERDGELVGAADLIEDYPAPGVWCVGLLLLVPEERQQGLGHRLWAALEAWVGGRAGHTVRLVVQEQNPGARRFWTRAGFVLESEVEQVLPTFTQKVARLQKTVATS